MPGQTDATGTSTGVDSPTGDDTPTAEAFTSPSTGVDGEQGTILSGAESNQRLNVEQAAANQRDTTATLIGLTAAAVGLREAVLQDREDARIARRRHFMTLLAILAVLVVVLVLQRQGAQRRDVIIATQHRIIDCTTPGGACYLQGQRQTAAVIGDPPAPINSVTVWTAVCQMQQLRSAPANGTSSVADYKAIHACLLAGLAGKPKP